MPAGWVAGVDHQCGTVDVPETRTGPSVRTLSLSVLRVKPKTPATGEPILHLIGGPGATWKVYLAEPQILRDLADGTGRELVLFDQRGVGLSTPNLDCQPQESGDACVSRLKGARDLAAYNTYESANDVADVAHALGTGRVNLWGQSYGTVLGLAVMRQHPEVLRTVALESVSSPPYDVYLDNSSGSLNAALGRVFADCAADPACKAAFPNPAGDLQTVLAAFEAQRATTAPEAFKQATSDFALTLHDLTEMSTGVSVVPLFLHAAATGSTDLPPSVAALLSEIAKFRDAVATGITEAMNVAVGCADYAPFFGMAAYQAATGAAPPLLREALDPGVLNFENLCTLFPRATLPPSFYQPTISDVPTLLLTGSHDSNTPSEVALKVKQTLTKGQLVSFPAWGHGILVRADRCALDIYKAFLAQPGALVDTRCVKPAQFALQ